MMRRSPGGSLFERGAFLNQQLVRFGHRKGFALLNFKPLSDRGNLFLLRLDQLPRDLQFEQYARTCAPYRLVALLRLTDNENLRLQGLRKGRRH